MKSRTEPLLEGVLLFFILIFFSEKKEKSGEKSVQGFSG
jgi:hypothetical protein